MPALLRSAVSGARVEVLLGHYAFLRRLEARARLLAGRGVEGVSTAPDALARVAELVLPGLSGPELLARQSALRAELRREWLRVVDANTIAALED